MTSRGVASAEKPAWPVSHDPVDDDPGDGEAGDSCRDGDESEEGGEQDAQPDALS